MDLNDLCITLILVNCVWLLAMRPARLWQIKAIAVLSLLGGTWYWWPEQAGYVAIGPWIVMILLPMWMQHATHFFVHQKRLRIARRISSVLVLLHPSMVTRSTHQTIGVLDLMYRGELAAGLKLAQQYGGHDVALRCLAIVFEAQMSGHWEAFENQLVVEHLSGVHDPNLLAGQLSSAAERGAWEEFRDLCHRVSLASFTPDHNAALNLRAFALLGEVEAVQQVCTSGGHQLAFESREFWSAVADQVSGATQRAEQRLKKLLPDATPVLRPIIKRYLKIPAAGPSDSQLRERALDELRQVARVVSHDARYAVLTGESRRWPVMTILLMLVICVVFLSEIPGGSEDVENLERMGAMVVPMKGTPGEWQNAFTAGFLHFGPLHLTLNLVGLLALGRLVERAWGPVGMLLLFLFCNLMSAALLPWLTFQPPDELSVFAGASGGIMGLLGGLSGQLLVGRIRYKTPLVRSQFRTAYSVILGQCVCDLMTPQVSMTCHLIGLVTGMIVGVIVGFLGGRRTGIRPI